MWYLHYITFTLHYIVARTKGSDRQVMGNMFVARTKGSDRQLMGNTLGS